MTTEKTGGAFLLQEQEPKKLLGIFVSTTADSGPGWIWGSLGADDIHSEHGGMVELALSRDVALRLAGLLQVLTAQNMCLRAEPVGWVCPAGDSGTFVVKIEHGPDGLVFVSWPAGCDGVAWHDGGGQVEWGLREEHALELSHVLIRELGRAASGAA